MTTTRRMRRRPDWWLAAVQAAVALPAIRVVLAARGYRRTVEMLAGRRHVDDVPAGSPVPEAVVVVARAVTMVAALDSFRSRCLARSIAIWWLAGRRGHRTELQIGVASRERHAVTAHAWVEYGGAPVNDTADVRSRYVVLPVPPPRG